MKKKIVIIVIIAIIIILSAIVYFINKLDINRKGSILFGNDYCPKKSDDYFYEDYMHPMSISPMVTAYRCKLCNKKYEHGWIDTPKICYTCATTTNRCQYCGKLENEN